MSNIALSVVRVSFCGILLLFTALAATAQNRLALVIGNDNYENLPKLQKAVNDANAVTATLQQIGFEVVSGTNLTRRQTNQLVAEFEGKVKPGDTALFFFAGHGVAIGPENYLIPVDMPKPKSGQNGLVEDEAHSVDQLVRRIQARKAKSAVFILDACRDNPFSAEGVRSIGGARGLTRMEVPSGVFVLYSAGIGQAALDRLGEDDPNPNSVFTRHLVPLIRQPGLSHVRLAKTLQAQVSTTAASISHRQLPAYYDQIIGDIFLLPGQEPADDKQPATQQQQSAALHTRPDGSPRMRRVAKYQSWGNYTGKIGDTVYCYSLSVPTSKNPANYDHGSIYFMVNRRSDSRFESQLEVGNYFPNGEIVTAQIGSRTFKMFTDENTAWFYNDSQERLVLQAMKKGASMQFSGKFDDGTSFVYEFGLSGITKSIGSMPTDCG